MLSETGNHTLNDLIYTPRLVPPFRRATKDGAFFVALSVYCLNSIRFRRKKTCKKRVRKSRNPLFPTGFCYNGGEGETRTPAPVSRPTPLAGAPRHQLEYFCIGSVYDTIRLLKERAENPLPLLSGGESGIRTHGTLPYDGFQDRCVITTSVSLRIRRKL